MHQIITSTHPSRPPPTLLPLHFIPERITIPPTSSRATNRTPPIPIILSGQPLIPILQLHPARRLVVERCIPSMASTGNRSDGSFHSLTPRCFAAAVAKPASFSHADEGCYEGSGDDEEYETHGDADCFA